MISSRGAGPDASGMALGAYGDQWAALDFRITILKFLD